MKEIPITALAGKTISGARARTGRGGAIIAMALAFSDGTGAHIESLNTEPLVAALGPTDEGAAAEEFSLLSANPEIAR